MRPRRLWLRQIASIVIVLMLSGMVLPLRADAQAGVDEMAFSPETGYFFFWDPDDVSLEDASSEPGFDHWRFTDGEVRTDISAVAEPGVIPEDCVRDAVDAIAADSTVQAIENLPAYGGGPLKLGRGNVAQFVLTVGEQDGGEKFAATVRCFDVADGEAFAVVITSMPARVYNERGSPWVIADGINDTVYGDFTSERVAPVRVPGVSGAWATLRTALPCDHGTFSVLAERPENGGPVSIDLAAIVANDGNGDVVPVTVRAWTLPQEREGSMLHLASGEFGLVSGAVEIAQQQYFELYYAGPNGETTLLAKSESCVGGGGGAPVPIDIE